MDLIKIAIASLASIVVLFLLSKLMGNKQMSELTMFDYINGITIGSIAAEMATSLENDFMKPLIAMVVYSIVSILISIVTNKSIKLRRFIVGKSVVLMDNGKLYRRNFTRSKFDMNEFLMECRKNGVFDISDIQTAILEPNGHVSILLKSNKRPIQPDDISMKPKEEKACINIILDGQMLEKNLKQAGKDEQWVKKELKKQGIDKIKDVFIAYCSSDNNLTAYTMIDKKYKNDIFQ